MPTTIQVNEDTVSFLKHLRQQLDVSSYDAVIKRLVGNALQPSQSLWGKGGRMRMKDILTDLRDEGDRY